MGINQEEFTVGASMTINFGDIVAMSATTNVIIQALTLAASNSTAVTSGGNAPILGVAMASIVMPASGNEATTGRNKIPVAIFDDNLLYVGRIYSATSSLSTQTGVTLGVQLQFQRWRDLNASTWWYSFITTTTNGEFKAVEYDPTSATSDKYGIIQCRAALNDTVRQG
jgi:hypothetical protein